MKYKHLSLILLLTILLAPAANARKYYDAVINHYKGHVKAVYEDGKLISSYTADGKEVMDNPNYGYVYDSNGYPIGSNDGSTKYTYQNGRLVQQTSKGSTNLTITKYYYDDSGNVIKYENYHDNDVKPFSTTYFYDIETDSHGNLTKYTRKSKYGAFGPKPATYTLRYEYYKDTPATKPAATPAKPKTATPAAKPSTPTPIPQPQSSMSVLDFFDYPCGDRQLSWSMTFTEARKALGSSAKKCEEPARYFDNNDSQGKIYLEGKSPIDFGLTDYKAYMLSGNIDYRGRSLNTLKYNRASAQIVFYKNSETYSPGQDMREYSRSHSRLTAPGEAAYDYLIEKIKASGAQIRKWKYDSHERVKSCKAVYKGRVFLLMLNKDNVYGNYYIEISTAAYYTENS